MVEVSEVEARQNYQLLLTFSTGEKRIFDMSEYLSRPVFRRLQHPAFFSLARVNYGTVIWPGEIDIAPETLYMESRLV